jgi:hypothetical protein
MMGPSVKRTFAVMTLVMALLVSMMSMATAGERDITGDAHCFTTADEAYLGEFTIARGPGANYLIGDIRALPVVTTFWDFASGELDEVRWRGGHSNVMCYRFVGDSPHTTWFRAEL